MSNLNKIFQLLDEKNIADTLSDEELDKIGDLAVKEYKDDDSSRKNWLNQADNILRLALQIKDEKNWPWQNASNVKYPLLTNAAITFAARIFPNIVQENLIVKCKIYGQDQNNAKADRALRISNHMSYQLSVQNKYWLVETDKLLHILPLLGTAFRKVYWDLLDNCPKSELCKPSDIIVNNNVTSLETAPRVTHRFTVTKNYITERIRAGIYSKDLDMDDFAPTKERQNDTLVDLGRLFGQPNESKNDYSDGNLYELIEQHRYLDLDGDGYEEPYIVVVHTATSEVLGIYPRYDLNSLILNEQNEIQRIIPIQHFVDYHCIPSPDGSFYSIGLGSLLYPINHTINSVINNLIDAGTLSNLQGGFVTGLFKVKADNLKPQMGEFIKVDTPPGTDIRTQIMPHQFKEPSIVLFHLLEFLVNAGQELASINDVLSGQALPQNSPSGTTQELVNQGLKVFNVISKRYFHSETRQFRLIYDLNAKYLPAAEYFIFENDMQAVAKQDYSEQDLTVLPVADPEISSELKLANQVNAVIQLLNIPILAQDINIQELLTRVFKSLKIADAEKLLIPPQVKQNQPPPPEAVANQIKMQQLQMQQQKNQSDAFLKAQEIETKRQQMLTKRSEAAAKILKLQADAGKDVAAAQNMDKKYDIEQQKVDVEKKKVAIGALTDIHNAQTKANTDIFTTRINANKPSGTA